MASSRVQREAQSDSRFPDVFFSSRRRHTCCLGDWSSDVCSSDLMRGELACFARPELKTERVTYSIPTPSALRGILEAILWKPAVRWCVDELQLLRPIRYLEFRRNEVNGRASDRVANTTRKTGDAWNYYADEDRAQRNTIALRDVDYAVTAHMEFTA